jgi:hypothetical protein
MSICADNSGRVLHCHALALIVISIHDVVKDILCDIGSVFDLFAPLLSMFKKNEGLWFLGCVHV